MRKEKEKKRYKSSKETLSDRIEKKTCRGSVMVQARDEKGRKRR